MKENSIKEDIKILEKKIEDYKPYKNIEYCSHAGQILQEEHKALEHILSDYKRVLEMNEVLLKENEKLKEENFNLQCIAKQYIELHEEYKKLYERNIR